MGASRAANEGPHWSFDDIVVDPTGIQERLPIWVGGRTMPSLRRAVELATCGCRSSSDPTRCAQCSTVRETPAWAQRSRPLDVALWPEPPLDPLLEADRVIEQAHEHLASGATILNYRFPSTSVADHIEQMEALTTLLDPTWSTPTV